MKKYFTSTIFIFLFVPTIIFSSSVSSSLELKKCTSWKIKENYKCIFNNRFALIWIRQCLSRNVKTSFCSNENPNELNSLCTKWIDIPGTSCSTGNGLGRKWIRSCTDFNSKTLFCSDEIDPNDFNY